MTEWNVHGLVSNKTVILRRSRQPPTQALLGELVLVYLDSEADQECNSLFTGPLFF